LSPFAELVDFVEIERWQGLPQTGRPADLDLFDGAGLAKADVEF
jgi:hypothetical protein